MKKKTVILLYVLAAVIAVVLVILYRRKLLPEAVNNKIDDVIAPTSSSPAALIYNAARIKLLDYFNASQAQTLALMLVAQSKLESDRYTSPVFHDDNNAFGYHYTVHSNYIQRRSTLHRDENEWLAHYANIQDSARDAAVWLGIRPNSFSGVQNVYDYATALKSYGYYSETAQAYAKDLNALYTTNIV